MIFRGVSGPLPPTPSGSAHGNIWAIYAMFMEQITNRVKSGKIGHQVNSDTRLQTVEIQMRRLLMSRLIRIFTVCLVYLFIIPIIEL